MPVLPFRQHTSAAGGKLAAEAMREMKEAVRGARGGGGWSQGGFFQGFLFRNLVRCLMAQPSSLLGTAPPSGRTVLSEKQQSASAA